MAHHHQTKNVASLIDNFEQHTKKDKLVVPVQKKEPEKKIVTPPPPQSQHEKPHIMIGATQPINNSQIKKPTRRLMSKAPKKLLKAMVSATNANDQPLANEYYTPNLNNDPSLSTVRIGDKNVTFVSGWQHKDGNKAFASDANKKLQYAANLEHGVYLKLQDPVIGSNTNEVTRDFVVDLDGQVDQIIIPDYPEMQTLGTEFSIEFWLRLSAYPLKQEVVTIFSRGNTTAFCRLSLLPAGELKFESGHAGSVSTTQSAAGAFKQGAFHHVAITGTGGKVQIYVDAVQVAQGTLSEALGGKSSPFIFGCDATSNATNFFCGQITALYIYNTARTSDQIQKTNTSKNAPSDAGSILGQWELSSSNRISVTCYFVTPANEPEDETESDYTMSHRVLPLTNGLYAADVPAEPIVDNDTIYLFRQTTNKKIVVDILKLSSDTLVPVANTSTQTLALNADCYRGWFSVVKVNSYWIVFNCGSAPTFLSTDGDSLIWQTFQEDASHNLVQKTEAGFSGKISPKTTNKTALHFTTHPSVTYSNSHVVLTVASDDSARVMVFDFLVDASSKLASVNGDLVVQRVGPDWDDNGTKLYVTFSQPFSGIAPTQSTLPPNNYAITKPDNDHRYNSVGKVVRLRHTMFGENAPIEPPMSVLCGTDWNADGTPKTVDIHSQDVDTGVPLQQHLFRMVNLSKPNSTTFADGDAVSLQVFLPQPEAKRPKLASVEWQMISPNDGYRADQTAKWVVNNSTPFTGKATSLNQVFGIYGVDWTADDEESPLQHTPSNLTRIIMVPGVFANAIDPAMVSGVTSLAPTNPPLRDDEFKFTRTMQQNAMPVVYMDSFGTSSITLYPTKYDCTSYFLCHTEKSNDADNNRMNFEWLERKLVNEGFMQDKVIQYVDNNTPTMNWSWFSWRVTTPHGGYTLKSGQEVLVEGFDPDNDNTADRWVRLNVNNGQWKVVNFGDDEKRWHYNFWIFKVTEWSAAKKTVVKDVIHAGDWVMLWPRSEEWANKFFHNPVPTQADIESLIAELNNETGQYFAQPYQMQYTRASVLPGCADVSAFNQSVEKTMDNLEIPPSSVPALWTGLLNFARTVTVPQIETYNNNIRMTFRGNGHPLLLANGLIDPTTVDLDNNHDFFQEGAIGQTLMTTGLYYKLDYVPAASGTKSKFTAMNHIDGLAKYEFAVPPPNFQWTVPPPYKVTGMVELIGNFCHQGWTLDFLPKVIRSVVGRGTYHEGMWKPTLTVPLNNDKVNAVRIGAQDKIAGRIKDKIADWEHPDFDARDKAAFDSYYTLADLVTARAFMPLDDWKGKIDSVKVDSKYQQIVKGDWFKNQIRTVTQQLADDQIAQLAPTYAAYGGPVQLIASFLTSDAFINQLLIMDMKAAQAVVNTHLAVLATFNPEVTGSIGGTLMTSLCANKMATDPGSIMNNLTLDQRKEALTKMIISLAEKEGKDADADLSIYALKAFLATQSSSLGVLIELRNQKYELSLQGKDAVDKMSQDPDIWNPAGAEKFPSDAERGRVKTMISNEDWPKVKSGLGLIATGCSYYSLGMMAKDWQGTDEEKFALAANVIGTVGGTIDTLKLARDFYKFLDLKYTEWRFGVRAPAAVAESVEELTTLAKLGSKLSAVVEIAGPIADAISLGLSVYSLTQDIEGHAGAYQITMDACNVALGVAGIAASLGMMAGAAFAGPLAAAVVVAAVVLVIIDACKSSEEQEEEERKAKEQKEKHQRWKDWSRHLLNHIDVIIPGTDNPDDDDK